MLLNNFICREMLAKLGDYWQIELIYRITGVIILICIYYKFIHNPGSCDQSQSGHASVPREDIFVKCESAGCVRCNARVSHERQLETLQGLNLKHKQGLDRVSRWFKKPSHIEDDRRKPTIFYLPEVISYPVMMTEHYAGDVSVLESGFDIILEEYLKIATNKSEANGWKGNSTPEGTWSVYYLINQGVEIVKNSSRCAGTMQALRQLQQFMKDCSFGNACFSVVEENTLITGHYGPCNVRTRCHLGLVVPRGCVLSVDDVNLTWKEGECILFDDSYLHSVSYNKSSEHHRLRDKKPRVIFMVDLWHHELTKTERSAVTELFPAAKA